MIYLCNFLNIYYGQLLKQKQTSEPMTCEACEWAEWRSKEWELCAAAGPHLSEGENGNSLLKNSSSMEMGL